MKEISFLPILIYFHLSSTWCTAKAHFPFRLRKQLKHFVSLLSSTKLFRFRLLDITGRKQKADWQNFNPQPANDNYSCTS